MHKGGAMGKVLSLVVSLLLVAIVAVACGGGEGSGESAEQPFTVGVSNGFVASEWRTQMIEDLKKVNSEYMDQGVTEELVIESADVDVQGQVRQIRNLINRGVDAIIVNPNSQDALNQVIQEAADADITVIAVDQEVSAAGATNVVIDQKEWAKKSAEWLAEQLGGEGDVVMINGIAGHPANEARVEGVKEVFGESTGINILNEVNADWDQAKGQQAMANLLASQPNLDGVWTQDGMAQGALQAVKAANPDDWPVMVGEARGGYIKLWNEVKQDRPEFTSFGVINPPGVGASGLRVAVEMLQDKELKNDVIEGPFDNSVYVPIPGVVDESNFQETYEEMKDRPDSYTLDGIISQEEAQSYFQ